MIATLDAEVAESDDQGGIDAATFARGAGRGETRTQDTHNVRSSGTGYSAASATESGAPPPPSPQPTPATAVTVTKLDIRDGGGGGGGGTIGVRVTRGTGSTGGYSDIHAPSDAEQWAMLFEQSKGRFPIQVSRLQGKDAFGCDCLSFECPEDREAFKEDPKRLS